MVRLTDRPDMTLAVHRGLRTTTQQQSFVGPTAVQYLLRRPISIGSLHLFHDRFYTKMDSNDLRKIISFRKSEVSVERI